MRSFRNNNLKEKFSLRQKILVLLTGVCAGIVLLEIGLRAQGFFFLSLQAQLNKVSLQKSYAYRILCLGESMTMFGGDASYPSVLERILNERGQGRKFSVINLGLSCTDSTYVVRHIRENLRKYAPDMVVTMMGIGDGAPPEFIQGPKPETKTGRFMLLLGKEIKTKIAGAGFFPSLKRNPPSLSPEEAIAKKTKNYRMMKEFLDKEKIPWICVQYPTLSVGELKNMFGEGHDIIFVDNESNFKEAVQIEGADAYFIDRFAGSFGHCTPKGNRLLAENIARTILQEYFNLKTEVVYETDSSPENL